MHRYVPLLVCALLLFASCTKEPARSTVNAEIPFKYSNGPTDSLKINQIEIIASHNSYHKKTDSVVYNFLIALNSQGSLPGDLDPHDIDYSNLSLPEQLQNYGVRGFELDVWNDPTGGRFYYRAGLSLNGLNASSYIPALFEPGFKVLHIPDFDYVSTNYTFKDAMRTIKTWSDGHPNHIPIFINVETEVSTVGDQLTSLPGLALSAPFDASAADNLDLEIKSVFGDSLNGVITPDKVRGSYATLEAAVLANNWPTLAQARGKVIFIIDPDGSSGDVYKTGHPSLQGRAMFVYTDPGHPESAFVKYNDASGSLSTIQQAVRHGYIVRTQADEATQQARTGSYARMNDAFAGWAQIVSTDYYRPDPRAGTTGWTNYQVKFDNGQLARINGISAADKVNIGIITE